MTVAKIGNRFRDYPGKFERRHGSDERGPVLKETTIDFRSRGKASVTSMGFGKSPMQNVEIGTSGFHAGPLCVGE